jgi:hypothetical protein
VKRFRLRLSSLLWLVVIAAAFLGGIRYGEYRQATRRARRIVDNLTLTTYMTLTTSEMAGIASKLEAVRPVKPRAEP